LKQVKLKGCFANIDFFSFENYALLLTCFCSSYNLKILSTSYPVLHLSVRQLSTISNHLQDTICLLM